MLLVILAEPAAPRCQAAGRKRWVLGTRSWGGVWEQGLQGINATSRLRSSQASIAAGDSDPFPLHPLEAAQRGCIKGGAAVTDQRLLGASPANQCLQRAPKELLVALGPGADAIDEQVSPGHGGDKAGVAGACGNAPRQVAAS
jgi:hypothetical protein